MKCFPKGKERLRCSGSIRAPHQPLKWCRGFYDGLKKSGKVYKRELRTAFRGRERPIEAVSLRMDGKKYHVTKLLPCSLIGNQTKLTGAVLLKVTNNF
jgi:hypothetical protein